MSPRPRWMSETERHLLATIHPEGPRPHDDHHRPPSHDRASRRRNFRARPGSHRRIWPSFGPARAARSVFPPESACLRRKLKRAAFPKSRRIFRTIKSRSNFLPRLVESSCMHRMQSLSELDCVEWGPWFASSRVHGCVRPCWRLEPRHLRSDPRLPPKKRRHPTVRRTDACSWARLLAAPSPITSNKLRQPRH